MAEDLDEASNELIITDEDSVRYSVGETFVTVENDEVGVCGGREGKGSRVGGRRGGKKKIIQKNNLLFPPPFFSE